MRRYFLSIGGAYMRHMESKPSKRAVVWGMAPGESAFFFGLIALLVAAFVWSKH
jgi:hypothetical protein